MNQVNTIHTTTASSEAIGSIVGKIEDALEGEASGSVIIALLSLVILLQKPDISPEQLQSIIRDTSHYICLALDESEINPSGEPIPSSMLN